MNFDKLTKKSIESVQRAQSIAIENQNQQVCPEHLTLALIEDENGLARSVLERSGANVEGLKRELNNIIEKIRVF